MSWADCDRVYAWLEAGHGEKLTTLDRGILLSMAYAANTGTGLAWLGQDRLAARWGVSTRAVKRTITRLHEHGLIVTVERGRGQRRARYALSGELSRGTEESPYSESRGTEESKKGDRTVQVGGPRSPSRGTDGSPVSGVITESNPIHRAPDGATADDDDDAPGGASTMDGLGPAEQDVARRLPDNWSVATAIAVTAEIRQRFNPRNLAAYVARLSTEDLSRIVRDIEECAVCGLRGVNDNGLCPEHAGAAWSTGNGHSTTCPRCGRPWPRGADVPDDRICTDCRTSPARAAVEKIATIFGDDAELHVDDEHDLEYGLTRAGVYLVVGGSTQEDPTLVAVWAEHDEDGGAWPEDKPLPDEPFRDRAVKNRPSEGRFYRPDDAIALAEHWHQATQEGQPA